MVIDDNFPGHDTYEGPPEVMVRTSSPGGRPRGCNASWNLGFKGWGSFVGAPYLLITNNDVLFTKGWERGLQECFVHTDCGISGPMSNQPGHQPRQKAGPDDISGFFHVASEVENYGEGRPEQVPFVNGFCFMLHRDRLIKPLPNGDMFSTADKNFGGEDDYQNRMNHLVIRPLRAYIGNSFVFHFKDVSLESHKWGRMGMSLEKLPRRLEE